MPFFVKAFWHSIGREKNSKSLVKIPYFKRVGCEGKNSVCAFFSYAEKGKKHSIQGTTRGALLKSKILKA